MSTLQLTSPYTRGLEVRAAQAELKRGKFLAAKVDGVFGPETGRAVRSAKFWLGFADRYYRGEHGEVYGPTIKQILSTWNDDGTLPTLYASRRKQRIKARSQVSVPLKAARQARKYLGDTEKPPGSNVVPWASGWYGLVGPWCAMAFTRWAVDARSKSFKRSSRYAYVPYIVHDARYGKNGLKRTFRPSEGAGVCFDWTGDGLHDHIEIVIVPPRSMKPGTAFTTIGGNTSSDDAGDQSNGGGCYRRDRKVLPGSQTFFFSFE